MSIKDIILGEINGNLDKNNSEIADILLSKYKKEFSSYANKDSVRRKVSKVRNKSKNPLLKKEEKQEFKEKYTEFENTAEIDKITSKSVRTLEDLINVCNIDVNIWDIFKWECSVYESHTRLRHYDDEGDRIDDEHKIVPLYRVKAFLRKKVEEIQLNSVKDEIIEEMKNFSPKYPEIKYKIDKNKKGYLLEINIADLHFGRLTWNQETGADYDIKIARELFLTCIIKLIEQSKGYNISRILFILGNDYFNVDNIANTTTAGTPQDEDSRWKKTFKKGRELIIEGIDLLSKIAPVEILVVPGNHDTQRTFYLGDAIECWYNNSKNVRVDNSPKVRKYYQFGKCMILFSHGRDEKLADYPLLMASEEPRMWADTKYREIHLGEIHHKKEVKWLSTEEYKGATVRYMRSLVAPDAWSYTKGFISQLRAGEAFIWDEDNGLIAQFTASI